MTFKHKLSRRLAQMRAAVLATVLAAACGGERATGVDDGDASASITAATAAAGDRVAANRWVEVRAAATRNSAMLSTQRPGAQGTIVAGPVVDTNGDYAERWQINFDIGTDGWVLGRYLDRVGAPPPPTVASVTLTPETATLAPTATLQLTAVARSASGVTVPNATITWSSYSTAATVSASGLVRAVSVGNANIVAASNGRADTTRITVSVAPAPAPVATVAVSPATVSVNVGSTTQLTATTRDAAGNVLAGRAVTWSSSNTGAATVSGSGLVSGVAAGLVTITATSEGRSATAAVTIAAVVTPPPPPPPPAGGPLTFASDFSTAQGTSVAAVQDGGRWQIFGGAGLEVIPSAGLSFPSANVLRVTAMASRSGFGTVRTVGLGQPNVGESRYYRVYFRAAWPDNLSDGGTHPIQDGQAGSNINWELQLHHNQGGAGNWALAFQLHTNNGFADYVWNGPVLRKHVTYRFEWQIHRTAATTFALHVRVYDASGALLYDDDDFVNNGGNRTLATQPALLFNNVANMDGLNAGLNGLAGTEWGNSTIHSYQGAFAISRNGWLGAYQTGEGR